MAQEIIKIETINTDVINVATTEVITIQGVGLQGDSGNNVGVLSFNGRAGVVSPELDDYQTSLITNESNVSGATSTDAFNSIQSDLDSLPNTFVTSFDGRTGAIIPTLGDYETSLITNDSNVTGATSKDALNTLDAENDAQDILIQGNTDDITALDVRVTQNEADIVIIQGEQVTQDGRLDAIEAEQVTQDGRLDTIEAEQVVQNDAITAIEDTALFEAPDSPHPINYVWLGSQIDYDAIISYDDSTLYNVNNNLETKALWFRTQNVSPITLTIAGTVADWKATNSDEGTALGVSNPTFTYQDSSVENQVYLSGFEPLNVTQIDFRQDGLQSISDLSGLTSLTYLQLYLNQLTDVGNLSGLTSLTYLHLGDNQFTDVGDLSGLTLLTQLYLFDNQLTDVGNLSGLTSLSIMYLHNNQLADVGDLSGLTSLTQLRLESNQLTNVGDLSGLTLLTNLRLFSNQLTDIGGIGSSSLTIIRLENNALIQTCVDQVIIDCDTLGASNGTLNLSGGTNHYPTLFSKVALDSLISKSWTVTVNADPTPLSFLTSGVSPITPTITGTVADWSSDGSTEGTVLGSAAPTFNYVDTGETYLVEATNFDPLNVTEIDSNTDGLQSISDLSGLTSLNELLLYNNQLTDVSGLSNLTSLTQLRLENNQLTDIGDLSGLTSLNVLRLYSNQLTDIGDLSGITLLTVLYLYNNQLTDIGDLSGLTSLTQLRLENNQLTDVGDLSGLTSLTQLRLYNNQLTNVGDLSGLTSLTLLYLFNSQLTDIGGIGSASLTNIRLEDNALIQSCVDQVIIDCDTLGASNGTLNLSGGTNSAPSGASSTALANLISKGWTVSHN